MGDTQQEEKLRKHLSQYPGATPGEVDQYMEALRVRAEVKADMIKGSYSNVLAEMMLDRRGFPRPPGWRTVFFYPDGNIPRIKYLVLAALIGLAIGFFR